MVRMVEQIWFWHIFDTYLLGDDADGWANMVLTYTNLPGGMIMIMMVLQCKNCLGMMLTVLHIWFWHTHDHDGFAMHWSAAWGVRETEPPDLSWASPILINSIINIMINILINIMVTMRMAVVIMMGRRNEIMLTMIGTHLSTPFSLVFLLST